MSASFLSLHEIALRLFQAGIDAADPYRAVARSLDETPPALPGPGGRWTLLAAGKAAPAMMRAALDRVGPCEALVVTHRENAGDVPGAEVRLAGHPVPDADGAAAAEAMLRRLAVLGPADRVLLLLSGGASALLPAPVAGVTLADKIAVNRLLLASGADIAKMNLVRQNLSRLKGGGLARAAAPATVTALILSDVIGDDLSVIASGPTVPPAGGARAARAVLEELDLWAQVPASIRDHLDGAAEGAPVPAAENRLVGSNAMSLAAMAGAGARVWPEALCGDVAEAAGRVLAVAADVPPGVPLAFGGETTVRVTGSGRGGRNQELALRVAMLAEAQGLAGPWAFLAAGTDGRDGPTDAAGAIVGPETLRAIRAAGMDPAECLARNDSYRALDAGGALLRTGATGTNVADLSVFVRGEG